MATGWQPALGLDAWLEARRRLVLVLERWRDGTLLVRDEGGRWWACRASELGPAPRGGEDDRETAPNRA